MWDVDREQLISRWEKERVDFPKVFWELRWSEDSARVAVTDFGDVDGNEKRTIQAHIINANTGTRIIKHTLRDNLHGIHVDAVAWSLDRRMLACGCSEGRIDVVDAESGQLVTSCKPHNSNVNALAWSPDGRRLASGSRDGSVKVLAAQDGAELLTFTIEGDRPTHLAWSADGRKLAAGTANGNIQLWDASRAYEFHKRGSKGHELAWLYYGRARSRSGLVDEPALCEFLRLAPDRLGFWESRGHARATLGELESAAEEFAKAVGPEMQRSFDPAHSRALALLGAVNLYAYRTACAILIEEFHNSDIVSNQTNVAWLCVLAPNPAVDSTTVLQMAQVAVNGSRRNFESMTLGASLFRDGQNDESVATLTTLADQLQAGDGTTDLFYLACAEYFLTLARHQQGHTFQARRQLNEANGHAEAFRQVSQSWTSLVALDALQREAEATFSED